MTTHWTIRWSIGLLGFGIILGYFITNLIVSKLRERANEKVPPGKIIAFWTGTIERFFFIILVAFEMGGAATVMIAWIIFKVAPDWDQLKEDTKKEELKGPAFIRLLGNVLSMIFALVGGLICSGKIDLSWLIEKSGACSMMKLNVLGYVLNFLGVILLLKYAVKTSGAPDQGTKDYLASRWWHYFGYILLGAGFLVLVISNSLN